MYIGWPARVLLSHTVSESLIQVENDGLFDTLFGKGEIDLSLLDFFFFNIRKVLKETYRLENVNREFSEDWSLQLQVFESRLIINPMHVLFSCFIVIVGKNVTRHWGGKGRYKRI